MKVGVSSGIVPKRKPSVRPLFKSVPTLYDVCELSGVSSATVSRVFSGATPVSERTRKRVTEAARQLGYVPSHAGRALRSRRTQTIGAIFPEMARHFYPDVLGGIDEGAAEAGFDVLASFVGKHRNRAQLIDRMLGQGRVDALILVNLQAGNGLARRPLDLLPIVLIGRDIPRSGLPVIGMDNIGGATAMIEHLVDQGHRRIAILTGPAGNYDSTQRLQGCRRAMTRLGVRFDPKLVWKGEFTFASGVRAARDMVSSKGPMPDAVFCLNDAMAIGMIGELRLAGVSIPENIAIAGWDDVHEAAQLSLTTIAAPMRMMGYVAAQRAVDLITNGQKPVGQRLPVQLVVRGSSAGRGKRPTRR